MTEDDLTDRQRDVLRLVRENKSPTEIGKELGISSQGVHGHLRRLRTRGLIPKAEPKPAGGRNGRQFTPADAFAEVRASIKRQRDELVAHQDTLDRRIDALKAEAEALRAEKRQTERAVKDLDDLEAKVAPSS